MALNKRFLYDTPTGNLEPEKLNGRQPILANPTGNIASNAQINNVTKRNLSNIIERNGVTVNSSDPKNVNYSIPGGNITLHKGTAPRNNLKNLNTKDSNNFKVGNMDVAFDSSVSPEARQRFLQDPVKPTAQINTYQNRQLPMQKTFGPREVSPKSNYLKSLPFLTKENSDMGWQSRLALNEQMLKNYQSGLENQNTINAGMINQKSINDVSREQNKIDEVNSKSLSNLRNAQASYYSNRDTEDKNGIKVLSRTDDIGNKYDTFYDPNKGTLYDPIKGTTTKIGSDNQNKEPLPEGHPALNFLKQHPEQARAFEIKYGYLPEWAQK